VLFWFITARLIFNVCVRVCVCVWGCDVHMCLAFEQAMRVCCAPV
jgi:ketopantoate reductase